MQINSDAKTNTHSAAPPALAGVLEKSEQAKHLVEESANELSSVNTGIKKELKEVSSPGVVEALDKNTAVEGKVLEASEKLAVVNVALEDQIRDRIRVDGQLAEAVEQSAASRYAALHDHLTDLPNRALFDDRLEHGVAQAMRHGWALAVMFIDLDDFKEVNDTYGHEAGDRVLQTIAQRLKSNTRADDTISRYGGDEFLYLLMEAGDGEHVASIARKMIEIIQAPCGVAANSVDNFPSVKVSIGISIFPQDGTTASTLKKSADKAMYRAKRTKSGYSFAV